MTIALKAEKRNPALDVSFDREELARATLTSRTRRVIRRSMAGKHRRYNLTDPSVLRITVVFRLRYRDTIDKIVEMLELDDGFWLFPRYAIDTTERYDVVFEDPAQVRELHRAGFQAAMQMVEISFLSRPAVYIMAGRFRVQR